MHADTSFGNSSFRSNVSSSSDSVPVRNNNFFEIESESETSAHIDDEKVTQSIPEAEATKKTRKTQTWSTVARYSTYAEAHEVLCKEGFRKHGYKDGNDGRKSNYQCKKIKQTAKEQCAAQRRIFQSCSRIDFEIQTADSAHTCMDKE